MFSVAMIVAMIVAILKEKSFLFKNKHNHANNHAHRMIPGREEFPHLESMIVGVGQALPQSVRLHL